MHKFRMAFRGGSSGLWSDVVSTALMLCVLSVAPWLPHLTIATTIIYHLVL